MNTKLYSKIEIFTRRRFAPLGTNSTWEYIATTEQSHTCKEAKKKFCEKYGLSSDQVKCTRKI